MAEITIDHFRAGDVVTALCRRLRMGVAGVHCRRGMVLCTWHEDGAVRQQWFFPWQLAPALPTLES